MSKHMAALWKRCARNLWRETNAYVDRLVATNARLERERNTWKASADKAEAELVVLKEKFERSRQREETLRKGLREVIDQIDSHYLRAERSERMAKLWKSCAKKWKELHCLSVNKDVIDLWNSIKIGECQLKDCVEQRRKLAAMKKDARMLAELVVTVNWSGKLAATVEAAHRILEATKDKNDEKV